MYQERPRYKKEEKIPVEIYGNVAINNSAITSIMVLLCCLINAMIHRGNPGRLPGPGSDHNLPSAGWSLATDSLCCQGNKQSLGVRYLVPGTVPVYLGVNSKIEYCDNAMRCPEVRNF